MDLAIGESTNHQAMCRNRPTWQAKDKGENRHCADLRLAAVAYSARKRRVAERATYHQGRVRS